LLPCLTCNALTKGHRQNANAVPIRAVPKRCEGYVSQGRHPAQAIFFWWRVFYGTAAKPIKFASIKQARCLLIILII
jgi:hypothetical protein